MAHINQLRRRRFNIKSPDMEQQLLLSPFFKLATKKKMIGEYVILGFDKECINIEERS